MGQCNVSICPAGLVGDFAALYPDVTVVGSKVCIQFLKNLVHTGFKDKASRSMAFFILCSI